MLLPVERTKLNDRDCADVMRVGWLIAAVPKTLADKVTDANDGDRRTHPPTEERHQSGGFTTISDLAGAVRAMVVCIPPGAVATYGNIARVLGVGPRQVGRAMGMLDDGIPWHRVVHADGRPASCHGGKALADAGVPDDGSLDTGAYTLCALDALRLAIPTRGTTPYQRGTNP